MKTDLLSMSEELLWRAEVAPEAAPPFIECARHVALIVQWAETTDLEALTATFNAILTRHAVLRSTYVPSRTGPLRIVVPVPREPVSIIEIDGRSDDDRRQAAQAALASEVQAPFNVESGPLIRARLLLMKDTSVLAIVAHHLVFDVVSRAVLWRELQSYARHARGEGEAPRAASLDYGDYVLWQRHQMAGAEWQQGLERLTATLQGAVPFVLAGDSRNLAPSTQAGTVRFEVDGERVQQIRLFSRAHSVTLGVTLAAVWKLVFYRLTRMSDIVFGVPIVDRHREEFEALIGLFANLLVLRTRISSRLTFVDLVKEVRRAFSAAFADSEIPYPCVLAALNQDSDPAKALVRVVFNFINERGVGADHLPPFALTHLDDGAERRAYADLNIRIGDTGDRLRGLVVYKSARFSGELIEELVRHFERALSLVLATPERCIEEFDLASIHIVQRAQAS
jgi:hypothetical protein